MTSFLKPVCRSQSRCRRHRRAFTLIEIMVVLFILMVLAGVAVQQFGFARARAQRDAAALYISQVASALDHYDLAVGAFPTTEQGLRALVECPSDIADPNKWDGPYLKLTTTDTDPWGSPYQYVSPGQRAKVGFDIWSFGPDRTDGTDDDIGNW